MRRWLFRIEVALVGALVLAGWLGSILGLLT